MLRNLIVLPDGTELFSGSPGQNAIRSLTLTQCVNSGAELTLGSVCAAMLEADIITPGGDLSIAAGQEVTLYKVSEDSTRTKIGVFIAEKPTRSSANSYSLTAFDRIVLLDTDLTQWLSELGGWPYSLYDFAVLVCDACGVRLKNESIPNGSYQVHSFSATGVTGRQLISWAGEICGCFCRAAADGEVEFAWYAPADVQIAAAKPTVTAFCKENTLILDSQEITTALDDTGNVTVVSPLLTVSDDQCGNVTVTVNDGGRLYYYQGSLKCEDYTVAPVEKVQLRLTPEDMGTVYPDVQGPVNTYIITGNYLLSGAEPTALKAVAQTLYEQLRQVSYTPCAVTVPAGLSLRAGDTVQVTDVQGRSACMYIMERIQTGQREALKCTGSIRRDSTTVVNNATFSALSGRVLSLTQSVEGLRLENADAQKNAAALELTVDGIRAEVTRQQTDVEGVYTRVTALEQSSGELTVQLQSIRDDGVSRVTTATGYTFAEDGLHISKTGEEMDNRLDHTGMYVERSGEVILQANNRGVTAVDVTVRNYLLVGEHARFEDYSSSTDTARTACFYV